MTKNVNFRIPEDLHAELVRLARADERSLNSWLVRVLRNVVATSNEPAK